MEYVQTVDNRINAYLVKYMKKPTILRAVVQLFLILYAARLAPQLPPPVLNLFENQYFKLFIFSMILWTAQISPSTSLLIAVAFLVTMNYVNKKPLWEFLENVDAPIAPSKEIAVDASISVLKSQEQVTPVVGEIKQSNETIVVQPTIRPSENGSVVVNPTVVVAPAVVTSATGEKVIVKPEVTMIETQSTVPEAAPLEVQPAPSQQETSPVLEGCFPVRNYDMTKVSPFDKDDYFGAI
uniref:Uncharacterized protein n=1 Tax=viral metagenome TaxID=1070528 RepID=A0A6C0E105_9ZZZZ